MLKSVSEIDWSLWEPTERAVLCYIRNRSSCELLLMHKKRGLGKGLVNAPGGHIERGESPLQAVIRECEEEVGVTPQEVREVGKLHFHFLDGLRMEGTVFLAERWEGVVSESDEADPFWCLEDEIPYEKMWADDRSWMPQMLSGDTFQGYFLFEKEKMISLAIDFS